MDSSKGDLREVIGLLIEDDEMGLARALNAARAQGLTDECNCYTRDDVNWVTVKSFSEFTQYIVQKGLPDILAFDHDLGGNSYQLYHKHKGYKTTTINYDEYDEPTGFHCAKWLTEYCQDNSMLLTCQVFAHSMNPQGRENIRSILNNFKKFQSTYGTD